MNRENEDLSKAVWAFLGEGVPAASKTDPAWLRYEERCKAFPKEAIPLFLGALETGSEHQQYVALLCLRAQGWEAWGHGEGEGFYYRVRSSPDLPLEIVRPRVPRSVP